MINTAQEKVYYIYLLFNQKEGEQKKEGTRRVNLESVPKVRPGHRTTR